MARRRAVVIGGGVVGLACAYSLAKRDYDITIVDAEAPGAGASEGNAGWVTPSLSMPVPAPGMVGQSLRWMLRSDSPLYIKPTLNPGRIAWLVKLLRNCSARRYAAGFEATLRLNETTFDSFDQLADEGVDLEMHRAGLLFCFLDAHNRDHVLDELERARDLGYAPTIVNAGEVREFEPHAALDIEAGIYLEQERQVRPETLVTGYLKRLLDAGADLRVASPVQGFKSSRGSVVAACTADELIEGDEFVVAAGAHSGRVARSLGWRLPIDGGKGYSLHHEPAPLELSHALYLYEARVGATPFDNAVRFAGTMEFSGLDTRLQPKRVEAIAASARRYLHGWPENAEGRVWAGLRPMTPDGLPVIGRLAANVTVATGHAMLGVTLAPTTGELVARSIAEGCTLDVLKPFDPSRFR